MPAVLCRRVFFYLQSTAAFL